MKAGVVLLPVQRNRSSGAASIRPISARRPFKPAPAPGSAGLRHGSDPSRRASRFAAAGAGRECRARELRASPACPACVAATVGDAEKLISESASSVSPRSSWSRPSGQVALNKLPRALVGDFREDRLHHFKPGSGHTAPPFFNQITPIQAAVRLLGACHWRGIGPMVAINALAFNLAMQISRPIFPDQLYRNRCVL